MPRHFIIMFDEFSINSSDVKKGENNPEVIVASRCINVALFVSNNLRRDVQVSIAMGKHNDLRVISFPGESLRRVSPDERSISFFLLKAMNILSELELGRSKTMDNGIVVHRRSFADLLNQWNPSTVYRSALEPYSLQGYPNLDSDGLFVYSFRDSSAEEIDEISPLPRPSSPERFILDVNTLFDGK
ncbi:MAG: hypothetical protein ACTSU3_04940 [Candidatus Thorarchaeota archaeon]